MFRSIALRSLVLLALVPQPGIAEVRISGVEAELENNIRAYVSLAGEPCDAPAWRVRRRFRDIESEIRDALQPFGYYEPQIEVELELNPDCWQAGAKVLPGEPVRLRRLETEISGEARNDPAFAALAPDELAPGRRLEHAPYDQYKQALQSLAADRGYFDARFTENRLDIWPAEKVADARLHFDSGPRYRLADIRLQQDILEPKLVAAYVDLEPGSLYDGRELARARRDLSNSGYFGRVEILPQLDEAADGQVPLLVSLEPGTRIEYSFGVGASTDMGPRLRTGFRHNRLNARGHRLMADLGVSSTIQGLTAEYRRPRRDPRTDWMSYTGALAREDTDTFTNELGRVGLRRTKRLSASWIRTLSLDFSYERFSIASDTDSSTLLLPAIALDHKHADNDLYPNQGRRIGFELLGANRSLGSSVSFSQAKVFARVVRSWSSNGRWLARAAAGATRTSEFDKLPPSARFFAGGDESVRGFDYESLGPTDAEGNVIGGRNLLVASLEYEHRLKGNYYGAAFVDAGNAFNDTDFDPAVGAGLGIKWRSPLGPIRLYVGIPLSGEDSGARLHLRLGPEL